MKYSDEQRIKKIYENAVKLHEYIVSNSVKKEDLLKDVPFAVACHNATLQHRRTRL